MYPFRSLGKGLSILPMPFCWPRTHAVQMLSTNACQRAVELASTPSLNPSLYTGVSISKHVFVMPYLVPAIGFGSEERSPVRGSPEAKIARSARQAVRFQDLGSKSAVRPSHGLRLCLLGASGGGERCIPCRAGWGFDVVPL